MFANNGVLNRATSTVSAFALAVTTLVAAILTVTVAPAHAAGSSTVKQPDKSVIVGMNSSYDRIMTEVNNGWVYTLARSNGQSDPSFTLRRAKLSTFGTAAPVSLMESDYSNSTEGAKATVGDTVSILRQPSAMSAVGNTLFIYDSTTVSKGRLLALDLSALNDSSTGVSATIVAVSGTQNVGLGTNLSSSVANMVALSESKIIFAQNTYYSVLTKVNDTWTNGSNQNVGNSVWGVKRDNAGNALIMTIVYSSDSTWKGYTVAPDGTKSTNPVIDISNASALGQNTTDFTVDEATGDVYFISNNRTITKLAKSAGTYATETTLYAVAGAETNVANSIAAASSNPVAGKYDYDITFAAEPVGISVGDKISVSDYTGNQGASLSFNSQSANVVALGAPGSKKVTVRVPSQVNQNGITSITFTSYKQMNSIYGLAFDASAGLIASNRVAYTADVTVNNQAVTRDMQSLLTFKAHNDPLPFTAPNFNAAHKMGTATVTSPSLTVDISSLELQVYEGATAAESRTAAVAHVEANKSASCVMSITVNDPFNTKSCRLSDGLTVGKYYSVAAKATGVAGTNVVWSVPSATTLGQQVTDNAYTATLPTTPDPTLTGPGYAKNGPSSGAANDLIKSGAERQAISDGRGGKFIIYRTGSSTTDTYSVVHLKNTGEVDSSFGTNGIEPLTNQITGVGHNATYGWYDNGKFVAVDVQSSTTDLKVAKQGASSTSYFDVTRATLTTACKNYFENAHSEMVASDPQVISSAASSPMIRVLCVGRVLNVVNNVSQAGDFSLRAPLYLTLNGENSVTVFASAYGTNKSYSTIKDLTKPCLSNLYLGSLALTDPNPASDGVLFSEVINTYGVDQYGGNPPYYSCSGNAYGQTSVIKMLQVKTDGTSQIVDTTYSDQNWNVQAFPMSDHSFYVQNLSQMSFFRVKADGSIDSTFGTNGSFTPSAPACAGNFRQAINISEVTSGTNSGAVILTGWAAPMNFQGNGQPITAVGQVLKGAGSLTTGDKLLGAQIITSNYDYVDNAAISSQQNWSGVGKALSTLTSEPDGTVHYAYYGKADGIKTVKWDPFSTAVPQGEDPYECPAAAFEATEAAPYSAQSSAIVQLSTNKYFAYAPSSWNQNVAKKGYTYTIADGGAAKAGTFALTSASTDVHNGGFVVPISATKVIVGGGLNNMQNAVTSVELYDVTANTWSTLTVTDPDNKLADKRAYPLATKIANNKVVIIGGQNGTMYPATPLRTGFTITVNAEGTTATVEALASSMNADYGYLLPAGANKWMLLGSTESAVNTTQFISDAGVITNGPTMTSARMMPTVIAIDSTKIAVIGHQVNFGMNGPPSQSEMATANSFEIFNGTSFTQKSVTGGSLMGGGGGGAFVAPSGNFILADCCGGPSRKINASTGALTAGEAWSNALTDFQAFNVGSKVLLAGSGMGPSSTWFVFTEPAEPQAPASADIKKVVKGTVGGTATTKVSITVPDTLTMGTGATALSVVYANVSGNVLKASKTVSGASKLTLVGTPAKTVKLDLPLTADINAAGVGTISATVKQGTNQLGVVQIEYLAAKATPQIAIAGAQPNAIVPGMVSTINLTATTNVGNGTPALSYSSTTAAVCTVNATTGAVTRVARGLCSIKVSQATDLWAAAGNSTISFTFAKSTPVLGFDTGTPAAGSLANDPEAEYTVIGKAMEGPNVLDLPLTYSVNDETVCVIDELGGLSVVGPGTCTVTVSSADGATYNAATATRTYTISADVVAPTDTTGATLGDATFDADTPEGDSMKSVSTSPKAILKKTINLGRGWRITYAPTVKSGKITATWLPMMSSTYIGTIKTTFYIPKSLSAKAPTGWAEGKIGTTKYWSCTLTYGATKKGATAKKITQKAKAAGCTLPAFSATTGLNKVIVKNNWTRLYQKTSQSGTLTPQLRTANITLAP